jgi:AhpC/TSA family
LFAISVDSPEDSLEFTKRLGLNFPLLSDKAGAVSRSYVGLNYDDTAIPGVVIIGTDGRIKFRQIADAKDDRMTAAQVIDTLDRTLGTKGAAVDTGYVALERFQSRADYGSGEVEENHQRRVTFFATRSVLIPLNRYLLIGPWLAVEPRQAPLDVDFAIQLRSPFLGDIAAFELTATGGWTPWEVSGWNVGVHAGLWFALSPKSAFELNVGYDSHRVLDSDRIPAVFATFGFTKLLWKPKGPLEPQ